jgi:hypothetical protein
VLSINVFESFSVHELRGRGVWRIKVHPYNFLLLQNDALNIFDVIVFGDYRESTKESSKNVLDEVHLRLFKSF